MNRNLTDIHISKLTSLTVSLVKTLKEPAMHDSRNPDTQLLNLNQELCQDRENTLWRLLRFSRAVRDRVIIPIAITVIFILIGITYFFLTSKIYVSRSEVIFGTVPGIEPQLLLSQSLLSDVVESLKAETIPELKTVPESLRILHLRENISVRVPSGRPLVLELRYQSSDPLSAKIILEKITPKYVEFINREYEENAKKQRLTSLDLLNSLRNQQISLNRKLENRVLELTDQKLISGQHQIKPDRKPMLVENHQTDVKEKYNQATSVFTSEDMKSERTLKEIERRSDETWLSALRDITASLESLKFISSQPKAEILFHPTIGKLETPRSLSTILCLAIFLGLGSGLGVIYVLNAFDDRFHSPTELSRQLGTPLLGVISEWNKNEDTRIHPENNNDFEQFLSLKVALDLSSEHPSKLVISSADPGDGKTDICLRLAEAFAQGGCRTLLVDADLRSSGLSRRLGKIDSPGLNQIIASGQAIEETAHETILDLDSSNLDFLSSGATTDNPVNILTHKRFSEFIQWCDTKYDRIIVDTPATLSNADSAILGKILGNTLMIVRPDQSKRSHVVRACRNLWSLGNRIVGVVASNVKNEGQWLQNEGFGYVAERVLIPFHSSTNHPERVSNIPEASTMHSDSCVGESRVA